MFACAIGPGWCEASGIPPRRPCATPKKSGQERVHDHAGKAEVWDFIDIPIGQGQPLGKARPRSDRQKDRVRLLTLRGIYHIL